MSCSKTTFKCHEKMSNMNEWSRRKTPERIVLVITRAQISKLGRSDHKQ